MYLHFDPINWSKCLILSPNLPNYMIVYFPRGNFPVIKFPIGNNNTDVPAGLRVVVVWELLKVALSMGNSKIWFGVLEYDCADTTSSVAEFSVGTGLATIQHLFPLLIHEIHLNEGHSAVITHLTCNLVNFELPNRFL